VACEEYTDPNRVRAYIGHNMSVSYLGVKKFHAQDYQTEEQHLREYLTRLDPAKEHFNVTHTLPRHGWGRVNAASSLSLVVFRRVTRHTLADTVYVDIDMANAHPAIVSAAAQIAGIPTPMLESYIANKAQLRKDIMAHHQCTKDVAKTLPISLMFGGSFSGWVSDNDIEINASNPLPLFRDLQTELDVIKSLVYKANEKTITKDVLRLEPDRWPTLADKKNGTMALWCQTLERLGQEASIARVCDELKIPLKSVAPSQDGFMLPRKYADKYDIDHILHLANQGFTDALGFDVMYEQKAFDEAVDVPEITPEIESAALSDEERRSLVHDDAGAAHKILRLFPHWKYCSGELYVFDVQCGMWTPDPAVHRRVVESLHAFLYRSKPGSPSEKSSLSYGGELPLMKRALELLPSLCIDSDWLERVQNSSRGYILFGNGYWDAHALTFHPVDEGHITRGFDPNIAFFARVPRPYVPPTEGIKAMAEHIRQSLFVDSLGDVQGNHMLQLLARAFVGECMKKMLIGVGVSNSGKGVITLLCKAALGDYYGDFNGDDLAYTKNSADSGAKQRWMLLKRWARIIVSNELNTDTPLNGNVLKRMCAGGDGLVGRQHHGNETSFIPHFMPVLLCNDLPQITPCDDAVLTRTKAYGFNKARVANPTGDHELLADPDIKQKVASPEYMNGFIQLLLSVYSEWSEMKDDSTPAEVEEMTTVWVKGDAHSSVVDEFLESFEITGVSTDFVPVKTIADWLSGTSCGGTTKKLMYLLKAHCALKHLPAVSTASVRSGGKVVRSWVGVSAIRDESADDEEEYSTPLAKRLRI